MLKSEAFEGAGDAGVGSRVFGGGGFVGGFRLAWEFDFEGDGIFAFQGDGFGQGDFGEGKRSEGGIHVVETADVNDFSLGQESERASAPFAGTQQEDFGAVGQGVGSDARVERFSHCAGAVSSH